MLTSNCLTGRHVVCESCTCICHSDPELVAYLQAQGREHNQPVPRRFESPAPRIQRNLGMLAWLRSLRGLERLEGLEV